MSPPLIKRAEGGPVPRISGDRDWAGRRQDFLFEPRGASRSRPGNKCLTRPLWPARTQKLSERESSVLVPLAGQERERSENRLRLLEADVDHAAEAAVPA
jgi:hypothetical protein